MAIFNSYVKLPGRVDLDATNIFQVAGFDSPKCTQKSSKLLGFMEVHSPNCYWKWKLLKTILS